MTSAVLAALFSASESSRSDRSLYDDTILRYAIIKSRECITGRHLLETTVGAVAEATQWKKQVGRCESLASLAVEIGKLLEGFEYRVGDNGKGVGYKGKFVLVFDGVDQQRDSPPTLLPALARLGELVSLLSILKAEQSLIKIDSKPHGNFYSGFPTSTISPRFHSTAHPFSGIYQVRSFVNSLSQPTTNIIFLILIR